MKRTLAAASVSIAAFAASPFQAATPAAYAALDRHSSAACLKASGLREGASAKPCGSPMVSSWTPGW
jgi:hypothetical protein